MSYFLIFLSGSLFGGVLLNVLQLFVKRIRRKPEKAVPMTEEQYEQWCYDNFEGEQQQDYKEYFYNFQNNL